MVSGATVPQHEDSPLSYNLGVPAFLGLARLRRSQAQSSSNVVIHTCPCVLDLISKYTFRKFLFGCVSYYL